jgi:PAS domain S-box-containing protein
VAECDARILVVDDQPLVVQVCGEILAEAGYRVETACSGQEALDRLEKERFDLLVADLKMPGVDGLTVLRRARELHPGLVAVMITSYATIENAIEALRAGARDLLRKPFDPDDLLHAVGEALAARQRERERLLLRARLPILEISQALMTEGDVESLAGHLLEVAARQSAAEQAALLLLDEEADELCVVASLPDKNMPEMRVPAREGLARQALLGEELLLVEAPLPSSQDPLWPVFTAGPDTTIICVPLRTGEKIIGLLALGRAERTGSAPFSPSDLNLLSIMGSQIATALENTRLVEALRRELEERVRVEEALRESEEKYRVVADFTYDWEYWLGPDGRYIYVSPSCERITGYRAEEFLQDPALFEHIIHPDDRAFVTDHLKQDMLHDSDHTIDFRVITRSGEQRWIGHCCQSVYGRKGQYLGQRGSHRDITERKRAEHIMQARLRLMQFANTHSLEELLQATLDEAEALTGSVIGFYHFLDADQEMLTLQVWSTNTLAKMCTAEGKGLHYSIDEAGVWVDCVRERRPVIHNDYAALPHRKGTPKGHARIVRELVIPVFRRDKIVALLGVGNKPADYDQNDVQAAGMLADLAWDIVEHKRAEEALTEQFATLRGIIDSAEAPIFSLDRQYRYTSFNKAHAAVMKAIYGAEIEKGHSLLDYMTVTEDRETARRNLDRALAGECPVEEAYSGEELRSRRWFQVSHSPIKSEDGPVIGVAVLAQDITERKRTEEAVAAERQQFLSLLEAMPAYLGLLTPDLRVTFANRYFREQFGEPEGRYCYDYIFGRSERCENCQAYIVLETKRPNEYEWLGPNGRTYQICDQLVHDIDGSPLILEMGIDITERKRAEEALHHLNRQLRAISDCNEVLLRAEDEQTLLNDICRIVCDEAGYCMTWVGYAERDEAKAVRPVAWAGVEDGYLAAINITWADTERGRGPTGAAIRTGETAYIQDFTTDPSIALWRESALQRGYRCTIALPLKDETSRTFGALSIYSAEPNAFTPEEIKLLEGLAGDLAFGITTLRTRVERDQAERKLRESEKRFAAAFHASPNLIAITTLDGTLVEVNEGYSHLLGYSRAESIGETTTELAIWGDPADRLTFISSLKNTGQITDFETTLRRKDGSLVTVIDSARTIKLQGETCVLSVVHDITERKRAEAELQQHREHLKDLVAERTAELEAKSRELETFAYSVSHDLKAPLRGIDGYSRLLLDDHAAQLDDEGRTFLHTIRSAANQMDELINDLLDYSRLERRSMHTVAVDLPGLVEAVVAEFAADIEQRGVDLGVDVPCQTVTAEAEGLAQALRNILSNALKFTRDAPVPQIEIGGRETEKACILWVRDNGIGFDMQYHDRIFEIFQRLYRGEDYPGTGVGLAIVRKAMERMGGRVWAESAPGRGATFYLEIPVETGRRSP